MSTDFTIGYQSLNVKFALEQLAPTENAEQKKKKLPCKRMKRKNQIL